MSTLMGVAAISLLLGLAGIVINVVVLLFLHVLMPTGVLARYWTEPHFRPFELAMFTGTLYAPMRTVMLVWAMAFPSLGKRRNISGLAELVSVRYSATAKAFCFLALVSMTLVAAGTVGVALGLWLTGEPSRRRTEITVSLLVALAGIVSIAAYQWYWRRTRGEGKRSRSGR